MFLIIYLVMFFGAIMNLCLFPIHICIFLIEQIVFVNKREYRTLSIKLFKKRYELIMHMFLGNITEVQNEIEEYKKEKTKINDKVKEILGCK